MGKLSPEQQIMNAGVAKLQPLLASYGFSNASLNSGSSSGGRFATATFTRDNLEIGLIVRFGCEFGCPNYTEGNGYAAHGALILALVPNAELRLIPSGFVSYCAADGGDSFDALKEDLEQIILPALRDDPEGFSSALAKARFRI